MKSKNSKQLKLMLGKETLRNLSPSYLKNVRGGIWVRTTQSDDCPTDYLDDTAGGHTTACSEGNCS